MSGRQTGFTLVELAVALFSAALLSAALLQISGAAGAGFRLQRATASLQESARFGLSAMSREISQAAYTPRPWSPTTTIAPLSGSSDGGPGAPDTLVLRRWSERNCYDNPNPETDAGGTPRFHLRETGFFIRRDRQLALRCRYGPAPDRLVTQINNLTLAENVRSIQAVYAEDADQDGIADRWVKAGQWQREADVLGVRLALLLSVDAPVAGDLDDRNLTLLDESMSMNAGRLPTVAETAVPLRSRRRR